jgi:hypothetical protein
MLPDIILAMRSKLGSLLTCINTLPTNDPDLFIGIGSHSHFIEMDKWNSLAEGFEEIGFCADKIQGNGTILSPTSSGSQISCQSGEFLEMRPCNQSMHSKARSL